LLGWLVYRSSYIPGFLGILLLVGGAGWVVYELGPYLLPNANLEFLMITFSGNWSLSVIPPLMFSFFVVVSDSAITWLEAQAPSKTLTVADHLEPALREHLGSFQGALKYNIFDSRNEGTATGVEEMFMHAGLYDDSPRSRELVWIMLAQRAARGLGSLYAHANEMTMEEAGQVHMDWTPRGWMKTEPELRIFEQHLYLRQPGYGTSYVTGKYLLEHTLADYAKLKEERGEAFRMKDFFDRLNRIDSIPISLARWEMTGLDDEIQSMLADN
jgi:hypothetical protein